MADMEEVADALAGVVAGLLTGIGGVPVIGAAVDIMTGWPQPNSLKTNLSAGKVTISVYQMPGATSNVSRHERNWETLAQPAPSLTATATGGTITFAGSIALPLNIAVSAPGGCAAAYAVQSGDTLASIATAVAAALSAAGSPSTAVGAQVVLGNGGPVSVAIGATGTLAREATREKQAFQISIWAPTPDLRKATAKAFEGALMGMDQLPLPDGTTGMLLYMRSMNSDHSELENLYRRDIIFFVEYSVIETAQAYTIVKPQLSTTPQ